ncbi:MAG: hypothetical protein WC227_04580 [Patescibacteria group bacterium]|jgi:hypothetical protein
MGSLVSLVTNCSLPYLLGARLIEFAGGQCRPDKENHLDVIWTNTLSEVKICLGNETNNETLNLKVSDFGRVEKSLASVACTSHFERDKDEQIISADIALTLGIIHYQIRLEQA